MREGGGKCTDAMKGGRARVDGPAEVETEEAVRKSQVLAGEDGKESDICVGARRDKRESGADTEASDVRLHRVRRELQAQELGPERRGRLLLRRRSSPGRVRAAARSRRSREWTLARTCRSGRAGRSARTAHRTGRTRPMRRDWSGEQHFKISSCSLLNAFSRPSP